MTVPATLVSLALALVTSSGPLLAQAATVEIDARRAAILTIAESYATHEWRARPVNVRHGPDANGVLVDTPDCSHHASGWLADGSVNVGVPYQWGGFVTLDTFDQRVSEGAAAGHLPDSGANPGSTEAVGVDCSGFVSRCWDLPMKQSTRSLGRLCFELDGYDELLPGDILNSYDGHAQVFKAFVDETRDRVRVIEAAFPCVLEREYDLEGLAEHGLIPMRYKPLDPRWVAVTSLPASFELGEDGQAGVWTTDGDAVQSDVAFALPSGLGRGREGEWSRFRVSRPGEGDWQTLTRTVSHIDEDGVEIQSELRQRGKRMQTLETFDPDVTWLQSLIDFPPSGQKIEALELTTNTMVPGTFALGGLVFEAVRITATYGGHLTVRGRELPITVMLDAIHSPRTPMHAVLRLDVTTELQLGGQPRRGTERYELTAFHRRSAADAEG